MGTIWHVDDADPDTIAGATIAVVGYGNQGRSWAMNLRDSGFAVQAAVRNDASREQAAADGFEPIDIPAASNADIICILVPDDAIPHLDLAPRDDALTIVASGYSLAFDRFTPAGDVAMIAPRMLGPEVRLTYEEGIGFISAIGVHQDRTGTALARTLAVARALGGLAQGAIELSPAQEAVLDLAVEQVLAPALSRVNESFVQVMLEQGIPVEAIVTELVLSGEVERTYRLLREVGMATQMDYHSPTSQYGQMSRKGRYDHLDVAATMRELTDHIASGAFADEWDAEAEAGYPTLASLRDRHVGTGVREYERQLRTQLGQGAVAAS